MRDQRPRGCRRDERMLGTPKKAFPTQAEAEAFINGGAGLNAYQCTHCQQWHVGHKPGHGFGARKTRTATPTGQD